MDYLVILTICISAALFLAWALSSEYDKCYSRMERDGHAAMGCCGGLAGGTSATDYLSETCVNCPYLVLDCRDKEIALINDILEEAVCHGADAGGSYDQNEKNLREAINRWLAYRKLDDLYEVVNTDDHSHWCRLRIVEKEKKNDRNN